MHHRTLLSCPEHWPSRRRRTNPKVSRARSWNLCDLHSHPKAPIEHISSLTDQFAHRNEPLVSYTADPQLQPWIASAYARSAPPLRVLQRIRDDVLQSRLLAKRPVRGFDSDVVDLRVPTGIGMDAREVEEVCFEGFGEELMVKRCRGVDGVAAGTRCCRDFPYCNGKG